MKDKKGIGLILDNVAITVLSVICIGILILIIVKAYSLYSSKSDLEKAQETIDLIFSKIDYFNNSQLNEDGLLIYPPEGWFLKSYIQNLPEGECINNRYCFCMCDNYKCNSQKKCKGLDYILYISHGDSKYAGIIPLKESVEELHLKKESKAIMMSLIGKK